MYQCLKCGKHPTTTGTLPSDPRLSERRAAPPEPLPPGHDRYCSVTQQIFSLGETLLVWAASRWHVVVLSLQPTFVLSPTSCPGERRGTRAQERVKRLIWQLTHNNHKIQRRASKALLFVRTYWKAEPILLPFSGIPGSGQTSPARPLWLTVKMRNINNVTPIWMWAIIMILMSNVKFVLSFYLIL